MIAASANIPYNRCSRPSFIFWPAIVSGVGFHTTTPNGRASTITTINGEWKGGWSIFLRNSSGKYGVSVARHQVQQWQPLTHKVSNGVADMEITVTTGTRKSKVSKETSLLTVTDLSLRGKSAMPAYMTQKRLMSCAVRPMIFGKTLKKSFRTEVIAVMSQPISRKISALSLKYPTRQTESKGFFPNLCDGWWKELSHGLTLVADSPGTMRY